MVDAHLKINQEAIRVKKANNKNRNQQMKCNRFIFLL